MMKREKKGGGKRMNVYFLWIGPHYGKNSFTWAEIGTFLVENWWLVALFFILFLPRAYLLHREHKQMMEEQERYSEPAGKEESPPYEDTYLDTPRSKRVPDGEYLYGDKNYRPPKYEWRIIVSLLSLGFIIGMGGSVGGASDVLMLLMIVVLLGVLVVAKHLGPNWVHTSFAEDKEKKQVDWVRLRKEMLPYVGAFGFGLLLGLIRLFIMGG